MGSCSWSSPIRHGRFAAGRSKLGGSPEPLADGAAFRAESEYFWRFGRQAVAPFHGRRRQPASFSLIDYRLHNPVFVWRLTISLRDPRRPVLQPFRVCKDLSDFGISDRDAGQDSMLACRDPGVEPLALVAHGAHRAIGRLASAVDPFGRPDTATTARGSMHRPRTGVGPAPSSVFRGSRA